MQATGVVSIGLAIFAMLFGSGNIVFPLGLGRDLGSNVFFGIVGLALTGIIIPVLGLVATALFDGNYKKFFSMTGRIPGALIAFTCMLLIGPFGATPRCITLAYAAVRWHIPSISLFAFSLVVAAIIFASTVKKRYVMEVFGRVLAPIKLILLFSIIILGLLSPAQAPVTACSSLQSFFKGLEGGYLTLDLLATFLFSGLIVGAIKASRPSTNPMTSKEVAMTGLQAGLIGGLLLGAVYTGFCLLAAKYSAHIADLAPEQLLSALATLVLGPSASVLANATMAIACLTTAIAISAVFADYLAKEVFQGRVRYLHALLVTIALTVGMTNLGFNGIYQVIKPLALFMYPALIVLALANIAYSLWGFRYTKHAVAIAFGVTMLLHVMHYLQLIGC